MKDLATYDILGVPVACVSMQDALDYSVDAIRSETPVHIGVVNAAKIVNMSKDENLKEAVLASDVIFADGMSVVWAGKFLGVPIRERVTGIDLMFGLLERASEQALRVFLLGAKQKVVEDVANRIAQDYPGAVIAGFRNGYFTDEEAESVAKEIADAAPDILFVAITSPKKEQFLAEWAPTIGAKVFHGVGGSFDVYAGVVTRAPQSWQKLGLEWLYRLLQEPRRMWKRYCYTNTVFSWMLIREKISPSKPTDQ